jgi:hypothetical protein
MTFFDALGKQADKAKKFNELVSRLMAADLNETALQQVLAAGVDGGTAIAESILESADGVLRANDLTSAMQKLADDMGKRAATKYYKAGVDSATNFLKGVQDTIAKTEIVLANPNLTATDIALAEAGVFSPADFESIMGNLGNLNFGLPFNVGGIGIPTMMADGGVVRKATNIVAGESGPEAIIPLDKMASMGFGGNNGGITINVNGADPQAVVDALRRYQRQNGFVPITVGV